MMKSAHCFSANRLPGLALATWIAFLLSGCPAPPKPPPGLPAVEAARAMVRIDPSAFPNFSDDLDFENLEQAITQSIGYLQSIPASREFAFGRDRYTSDHILLSLRRFQALLRPIARSCARR